MQWSSEAGPCGGMIIADDAIGESLGNRSIGHSLVSRLLTQA